MSLTKPNTINDDFLGIPRSVLEFMLFRLVGLVLVFLLHVVLSNMMGAKSYGDYVIVISWLQLLVVISTFGMESSAARFLPLLVSQKKYEQAAGFVRFSYLLITATAILCSIGALVFSDQFQSDEKGQLSGRIVLVNITFTGTGASASVCCHSTFIPASEGIRVAATGYLAIADGDCCLLVLFGKRQVVCGCDHAVAAWLYADGRLAGTKEKKPPTGC